MAMYAEHLSDEGDFNNVRGASTGLESRAFLWALMRLKCEGLIDGIRWTPPGAVKPEQVNGLLRDKMYLTHEGFLAAEEMLQAKGKTRNEKIKRGIEFCVEAGMEITVAALEELLI